MPDRPHRGDEPEGPMLPPLDPSSPWNADGTRRPEPEDYELPLPSEAGRGAEGATPRWLDLLPSGDRVMLPRPRQTERPPHGPAETGRPPARHPGTPGEVTHDDTVCPGQGVVLVSEWRPDREDRPTAVEVNWYGGVAGKPR